jgi:hypothetical protein
MLPQGQMLPQGEMLPQGQMLPQGLNLARRTRLNWAALRRGKSHTQEEKRANPRYGRQDPFFFRSLAHEDS